MTFDYFSQPQSLTTSIPPSASSQQRTHGPYTYSTPLHPPTTSFSPSNHFAVHRTNDFSLPSNYNNNKPILSHFDFSVNPPSACFVQPHQPSPSIPANPQSPSVPHLGFNKNDLNDFLTRQGHRESSVPTDLIPVDEFNNSSTYSAPDTAMTHSTHDLQEQYDQNFKDFDELKATQKQIFDMIQQLLDCMPRQSDLPIPVTTPTSSIALSCTDLALPSILPTSMYSSSDVSTHHDSLTHDTYVPSIAFPSTVTTYLPSQPPFSDPLPQLCNHTPAFCQMIDPL